jgi:hypothetical protein
MTLTGRTLLSLREWPDEMSREPGAGHPSAARQRRAGLVCSQLAGTVSWWLTWLIFRQIGTHR